MLPLRAFFLIGIFLCGLIRLVAADVDGAWGPTTWQGEKAFVSTSHGWKAIVSIERGRLMHFGLAGNGTNLLFAPATRNDSAGWGGHRVWLGPQSTWSQGWPPPAAWEASGAESVATKEGALRLAMRDAGEGWPRLTRTYRWDGAKLRCGVELSGGSRSAQIIQIVQVPLDSHVQANPSSSSDAPHGYVLLPAGDVRQLTTEFTQTQHVKWLGKTLMLRHVGSVRKMGLRPQTLTASDRVQAFRVSRGAGTGTIVAEPDQGFLTQVYLGGHEPFIELEQLSPTYANTSRASFEMVIEGIER